MTDEDLDPWRLSVSPGRFDQQMRVLERDATVVSLQDLLPRLASIVSDRPLVAITFDDGYADNLFNAVPCLQEHGLPATVFACTGAISRRSEFWWDALERILLWPSTLPSNLEIGIGEETCHFDLTDSADYPDEVPRAHLEWRAWEPPPTSRHALYVSLWRRLHRLDAEHRVGVLERLRAWAGPGAEPRHLALGPTELVTLAQSQQVDVGAHTINHSALAALPVTQQQNEIGGSQTWLRTVLGRPITSFAYPFGTASDYTWETVDLVRKAGFKCGCSNIPGVVRAGADPFQLPRLQVENWGGDEFERQLREWQSHSG